MEQTELLSTKLSLPHTRTRLVARPHLLTLLDTGLAHSAFTLISAPPGFGKTTLLAEWLASMQDSRSEAPQIAWFSLDKGDNDPGRFWRYVIAACQNIQQTIGTTALTLLHSSDRLALESIVILLINDIARLSFQCILVLEDYHLIGSEQVHKSVFFLLEHLPANLHVVITTRSDPPFPIARFRARNVLTEVRTATLRFSPAETAAFLNDVAGCQLSDDDVQHLDTHTEGWITGLQLVALLLQGPQNKLNGAQFLAAFRGSHRHVTEYLVEEVLSNQPEHIQSFLLQTSILDRLTGSLCDALTGDSDGERMLEHLERANLFITQLNEAQRWYRYHTLFAEAVRHYALLQFGQERLNTLYRKASDWYEQHEFFEEAIDAAFNARDASRAAELIEYFTKTRGIRYDFTLHHWLDHLPPDLLYIHPTLCFLYAQMLFFSLFNTDQRSAYKAPLENAERLWREEGNLHKVGSVYALRTLAALWSNDFSQVSACAEQALQLLPAKDVLWRSISLAALGTANRQRGNAHTAYKLLTEAQLLSEQSEYLVATLPTLNSLADVLVQQGKLQQAAQIYSQVIERSGLLLVDNYEARTRLSAVYFEWNDLERAETHLQQVLAGDTFNEKGQPFAQSFLLLARIKQAHGEVAQAQEIVQRLIEQSQRERFPIAREELQAYQASWRLLAGESDYALHWRSDLDLEAIPHYARERTYIILARVLVAQGEPVGALQMIERWLVYAREQGRTGSEIALLVLSALAFYAQGEIQRAQQTIMKVLLLAQSQGYQRVFLEEGIAMAALLRATRPRISDSSLVEYIDTLLASFARERPDESVTLKPSPTMLMEPLSQHEYRVLRLLVAGLSNPEIANELVVSVNTVKTHVKNIYGKLNVNSRKEAREAARRQKLL
jgi:LuxR family maltose regulon positive regulatory protein